MTNEMELAKMDIYAAYTTYRPITARSKELRRSDFPGCASQDYRSPDDLEHRTQNSFFTRKRAQWQDHYDWAVALAEGAEPCLAAGGAGQV